MNRFIRAGALALCILLTAAACTVANAASDEVTVCQNGGPFDNNKVRSVLDPGDHSNNEGANTTCHSFPVSTRIYSASSDDGSDGGPLSCTTSDGVIMTIDVSVRFTLNTESHDQIIESFNNVLKRYEAWDDAGWNRMLRDTIRRELDSQVESTCRQFEGRELQTDEEGLAAVQQALKDDLRNRINDNVGTKLFCGPGVPYGDDACPELTMSVTRMVAANENTRNAFEAQVREEANTRAAEQRIQTANADAQAIQAQAAAIEEAGDGYVNLQLIELCAAHPEACPTLWVLPSGSSPGINVPAPNGG